jgi:glutathione reductase (NADPH)
MPESYDVIVIGTGTAGQTAAYDLTEKGLTVGVIEHSDRPGGTCALQGCQAKKWFYEGTEVVARSRHMIGIGIETPADASWSALRDAKNRFTSKVPQGTIDGLKDAGIDFIPGRARFLSDQSIDVDGRQFSARYFVVATGAVPTPLPFEGSQHLITSSQFMELERLPAHVVFVGGGFISFEFAHFAVRLGPKDARCTILEAGDRVLGPFDGEMVDLLQDASDQAGIAVQCNATIVAVRREDAGFSIALADGRRIDCDMVVHGAGRVADIADLMLEKADIAYSDNGITVDSHMATSNSHVFAAGDCADTIQLARVADAEAHVASTHIVNAAKGGNDERSMNYSTVPAVLFTYPQYGMVGATEAALQKKGVGYTKSFAKELTWPTYRRVGMRSAAYKILVGENRQVLGAHVLSDNATGLINSFALAMASGIGVDDLYQYSIMTPYPSRESDLLYMLKPLISG